MADVVKNSVTLGLEAGFADGDTRAINLPDPNTAINLVAGISALEDYAKTNQILIGDKTGADFTGFKSAKISRHTTVYLDLNAN